MCPTQVVYLSFLVLCCLIGTTSGHGRLLEPPSRSSMWRAGYSTPKNYNDHQLFCGGVGVQYNVNDGKCGVCGDPWNGPRENEAGGRYATGIIVRNYTMGQIMDVTVQLTANHKGYFEFHLCPTKTPLDTVTHECLDRYPLVEMSSGKVRYEISPNQYNFTLKLRLPDNFCCPACLFQWKYNAGNSWGTESANGQGCIGCGNQEQFYGCADIAIEPDNCEHIGFDNNSNNNNNNTAVIVNHGLLHFVIPVVVQTVISSNVF